MITFIVAWTPKVLLLLLRALYYSYRTPVVPLRLGHSQVGRYRYRSLIEGLGEKGFMGLVGVEGLGFGARPKLYKIPSTKARSSKPPNHNPRQTFKTLEHKP